MKSNKSSENLTQVEGKKTLSGITAFALQCVQYVLERGTCSDATMITMCTNKSWLNTYMYIAPPFNQLSSSYAYKYSTYSVVQSRMMHSALLQFAVYYYYPFALKNVAVNIGPFALFLRPFFITITVTMKVSRQFEVSAVGGRREGNILIIFLTFVSI